MTEEARKAAEEFGASRWAEFDKESINAEELGFIIDRHFAGLRARVSELEAALTKLRSEVLGMIGLAGDEIQQVIGVTNMRCLENRLEESRSVLQVEEKPR